MKNFNLIQMRCYLERVICGTALAVIGGGILYSILYEMGTSYEAQSLWAYVFGLIACAVMIVLGIFMLFGASRTNRRVFKNLSDDDRRLFYQEMRSEEALCFGHQLIMTPHFVTAYARTGLANVYIMRLDDLVACFGREVYGDTSNEPESYQLFIFDRSFKKIECIVKGDKAKMMGDGYKMLLHLSPWVFSDNYEEFMNSYSRKSKKKAYLKEIELRRQHAELLDDTIKLPEVVTAAEIIRRFNEKQSQEAPEDNPESQIPSEKADQGQNT